MNLECWWLQFADNLCADKDINENINNTALIVS